MKKWIILLVGLIGIGVDLFGQQLPVFDLYRQNRFLYNPSVAGAEDSPAVMIGNRYQWMGFEGAPVTLYMGGYSPITNNVGLGLNIVNEKVNVFNSTQVDFSYAYKMKLDRKTSLSIGLSAGLYSVRLQWDNVKANDLSDELLIANGGKGSAFDMAAGLEYRFDRFYLGLAAPNVFATRARLDNSGLSGFHLKPHALLYSGYGFETVDGKWTISPWLMLRKSPTAIQSEFSLTAEWESRLGMTAGYRLAESCQFAVYGMVDERIKVIYSYGVPVGKLSGVSNGSHEFLLAYQFEEARFRKNARYSGLQLKKLFDRKRKPTSKNKTTSSKEKERTLVEEEKIEFSLNFDQETGDLTQATKSKIDAMVANVKDKKEPITITVVGDDKNDVEERTKAYLQKKGIEAQRIKVKKSSKGKTRLETKL